LRTPWRVTENSRAQNYGRIVARILVADDNQDAADSMAILMRLDGHEVIIAYNGEEALALFQSFRPELAVLDIGMPNCNGYEVARRLRAGSTCPPVLVAVTGWGQPDDVNRALDSGFDHHFAKPVSWELLKSVIAKLSTQTEAS
jgi:CheY-like chemotaxis protein